MLLCTYNALNKPTIIYEVFSVFNNIFISYKKVLSLIQSFNQTPNQLYILHPIIYLSVLIFYHYILIVGTSNYCSYN